MISYSSSFLFRTKCKYCFSPPQKYETYFHIFLPPGDFFQILKDSQNSKSIDLLPISIIDQFIKFRKKDKIEMAYFSLHLTAEKSLSTSSYQKFKKPLKEVKQKNLPKFASCKCGASYWIECSIKDPDYSPECNKKSSYQFVLNPVNRRRRK